MKREHVGRIGGSEQGDEKSVLEWDGALFRTRGGGRASCVGLLAPLTGGCQGGPF